MSIQPLPGSEQLVTMRQADSLLARMVGQTGSATRTAIEALFPKVSGTATQTAAVAQWVIQTSTGGWGNPVRDANVGGRVYVAAVNAAATPTQTAGVRAGDLLVTTTGVRIAVTVPTSGAITWSSITTPSTGGGTVTTPTPVPSDQSPASPTSRPAALLGTTGTWTSTNGTSVAQSLADKHLSGVTATPAGLTSGVALTMDMTNFAHQSGNDLTVSLWGAASAQSGDVTVKVGAAGVDYAPPKTVRVTDAASDLTVTWPASEQLSLPVEQWRDVEVTIIRQVGGFTALQDLTLQSITPTQPTVPGADPLAASTVMWAPKSVHYSDLSAAPLSVSSAAVAAYVRGQATGGAVRLDCYADAPPVWMVGANTARITVASPASSTRGAASLMHNATGTGALDGVPLPSNAFTPANTFRTAIVACVETRQVWELLGLTKDPVAGWSAEWGGRVDDTPSNVGAMPAGHGYTGSGLAFLGGAIKVSEAADAAAGNTKAIPHAIGLNLPYGRYSSQWCWPATRSDGTAMDTGAPQAGQRLRLAANADLSQCTPVGKAVGEAMKRYGLIVTGGGERLSLTCESGAVEQARTGVDPWGAILGGKTVDTVLAGLPLDKLEAVSPGWGSPTWTAEPAAPPVTIPTPGATAPQGAYGYRRNFYFPDQSSGLLWLSGASCRGIEDGSEGMASPFAQWRGEPCYMGRTWWDQDSSPESTLGNRWKNWHASIDCGPGLMFNGETWQMLASGHSTPWDRLKRQMRTAREWWLSRRDPSKVNVYLSYAHEMNGDWYRWSINSGNRQYFIDTWKRLREAQLAIFPESYLTWNSNYESKPSVGMDWRRYIPDYDAKGPAGVKQWIDCGSLDYYNQWSIWATSIDQWNQIAYGMKDQWGGPVGIDLHRQFWEQCGLPVTVPEWGNNRARSGDAPAAADAFNQYMRKWAGVAPGRIMAEAYFNLSQGYEGKFAVALDEVGSPQYAERYRALSWGK